MIACDNNLLEANSNGMRNAQLRTILITEMYKSEGVLQGCSPLDLVLCDCWGHAAMVVDIFCGWFSLLLSPRQQKTETDKPPTIQTAHTALPAPGQLGLAVLDSIWLNSTLPLIWLGLSSAPLILAWAWFLSTATRLCSPKEIEGMGMDKLVGEQQSCSQQLPWGRNRAKWRCSQRGSLPLKPCPHDDIMAWGPWLHSCSFIPVGAMFAAMAQGHTMFVVMASRHIMFVTMPQDTPCFLPWPQGTPCLLSWPQGTPCL